MIHRILQTKAIALSTKYPVVTITGPRQSGKTTLVRKTFDQHEYFSLENPVTRELIQHDPSILFEPRGKKVIIDEVQKYPEILSFVQIHADEQKINGQFIITGSQSLLLSEKISQSLAGRTAILKLLPFSLKEVGNLFDDDTYETWIFRGFYPRIYDQGILPGEFYPFYFETYLQRDVREIQNVRSLNQFSNFVRLCAGRIGQILDYSSLANDAGITVNTVKGWLSVLEASYVITLLQPYYRNFNKRIIKSPKLYFVDVGLAAFLLNINKADQIQTHYLKGNLFENLIIIEILKRRLNAALPANLYFYRDSNKNEVDCIVEGDTIRAIEIKSSRTFSSGFVNGLLNFAKFSGLSADKGFIIYGGQEPYVFKGFQVVPWNDLNNF
ncbi:MAG: ATP-binding protein [Clostridia bacterium]|nr:ATP-binding protein [Clostridia bacterium]